MGVAAQASWSFWILDLVISPFLVPSSIGKQIRASHEKVVRYNVLKMSNRRGAELAASEYRGSDS